jgi:protoporphyrinogen oxidase
MRTEFYGIAEKYEEDYRLAYEEMINRINEIGVHKSIQFFNEKYSYKKGRYLALRQHFISEGEIDALTDNLSRRD